MRTPIETKSSVERGRAPWLAVAGLTVLCASSACSSTDDTTSSGPTGVAAVTIVSVGAASIDGGASFDCIPSGVYPGGRLPVTVAVTNFVIAPPGLCFGAQQCGQVALFVGPSASELAYNNVGSGRSVDVISADGGALSGQLLIRVELWQDSTHTPVLTPAGGAASAEITVRLAPPSECGVVAPGADAGADGGAGDAAGSDGSVDASSDGPSGEAASDGATGSEGSTTPDGGSSDGAPVEGGATDGAADGRPVDAASEGNGDGSSTVTEGGLDGARDSANDASADAPGVPVESGGGAVDGPPDVTPSADATVDAVAD